ncbi:MAG: hypothetical protein NVSMB38_25910 [Ktedonobacteraceae bacterium]
MHITRCIKYYKAREMNLGEFAERNDIVLRGIAAHRCQQLLDIFRFSRLNPGDYCQCYLVRHKLYPL